MQESNAKRIEQVKSSSIDSHINTTYTNKLLVTNQYYTTRFIYTCNPYNEKVLINPPKIIIINDRQINKKFKGIFNQNQN